MHGVTMQRIYDKKSHKKSDNQCVFNATNIIMSPTEGEGHILFLVRILLASALALALALALASASA